MLTSWTNVDGAWLATRLSVSPSFPLVGQKTGGVVPFCRNPEVHRKECKSRCCAQATVISHGIYNNKFKGKSLRGTSKSSTIAQLVIQKIHHTTPYLDCPSSTEQPVQQMPILHSWIVQIQQTGWHWIQLSYDWWDCSLSDGYRCHGIPGTPSAIGLSPGAFGRVPES